MVFVIKYDFVLAEDITLGSGCVLEFEGGSISGDGNTADTITGNGTGIVAGLVKIFNTDVTITGSWNIAEAYPEWYGAKGDGVTDDILAINKTIHSFKTNTLLSSKVYLISNSIEWDRNTCLYGQDAYKTQIKYTGTNYAIKAFGTPSSNIYPQIKCIEVTTTHTGQGIGIGLDLAQKNTLIEDCVISGFNIGLNVAGNQEPSGTQTDYNCLLCNFQRVTFSNNNVGAKLNHEGNNISFRDCSFTNNNGYALDLNNSSSVTVDACHFEQNAVEAIHIQRCPSTKIINNYFEFNSNSEKYIILVEGIDNSMLNHSCMINNNYININGSKGAVKAHHAEGITMVGNTFYSNDLYNGGPIIEVSYVVREILVIGNNFYNIPSGITRISGFESDSRNIIDINDGKIYTSEVVLEGAGIKLGLLDSTNNKKISFNSVNDNLVIKDNDDHVLLELQGGYNIAVGAFVNQVRGIGDLPNLPSNQEGRCAFYGGKPVWYDGNAWIYADGTPVT